MCGSTLLRRAKRICRIATVASAVMFLAVVALGEEVCAVPVELAGSESAKLAFTPDQNGGYVFDTGVLRGTLRQGGKSLGLSSVVHAPSEARLDGSVGILSYYRVFTTNKRYGTAAWDWPSTSKLLPDGAVQVTWSEGPDRPFEMVAIYRFHDSSTLDVHTVVKPRQDLTKFEVFLASYFDGMFPSPYVYVGANPEAQGKPRERDYDAGARGRDETLSWSKPGFLLARKSYGDWQMFPRDAAVLEVVHDGRWQKEPHPVNWTIMPHMAAPVCLRRSATNDLALILMSPPDDCFAIATPYEGEGHYSLYLSLCGRDVKAGQTARARSRFVVTTGVSDRHVLDLYRKYIEDLGDSAITIDGP